MHKAFLATVIPVVMIPILIFEGSTSTTNSLRPGVVPAAYLGLVTTAGQTCPEITAPIIAAQLDTESEWNPNAVSPAGAQGIAQFMPGTWPSWGHDENADGKADPFDPADAIPAEARFMCALVNWAKASGIPGNPVALALAAYNAGTGAVEKYQGIPPYDETTKYVTKILAKAATYAVAFTPTQTADGLWNAWVPPPAGRNIGEYGYPATLSPVTNSKIAQTITFALTQVGKPYEFGAHGPATWDCSGLIQVAYQTAGISIGGWTGAQMNDGIRITTIGAVLIPGADGTIANPGHVGLYIGDGLIIQAPQTGDVVRITPLANWTRDFVFAQRVV
jgi:cell wall-associated NlpC family hydrolase